MMATYLKSYTTFFETVDLNECYAEKLKNDSVFATKENMPSDKTQAVSYLSGLLLRHTLQLVCNAHAITDLRCVNAICNNVTDEKQDRLAAAIYPSASIMNHSCEPSIVNRSNELLFTALFFERINIFRVFKGFLLQFYEVQANCESLQGHS